MTTTTTDVPQEAPPGLKGLVVTRTALGDVRGSEGFYHYRQHSAVELAQRRSLEDVWFLLLEGRLPGAQESQAFAAEVAAARELPAEVAAVLPGLARACADPLAALRAGLSLLGGVLGVQPVYDLDEPSRRRDAVRLAAAVPTLLAVAARARAGLDPVRPDDDLGHAAAYLMMLTGRRPEPRFARALEQYLVLTVDHGFNASTFTSRVVASTGADVSSCLVAAVGALSGPLHGGAPSRALDALDAIATPDRARDWITEQVASGRRVMGFGHPVYRTEDPRSRMLRAVAEELAAGGDDPRARALVGLATEVERTVVGVLAELKPGRELHTNVEFYAGVVMELCGLPRSAFTPTFAVARVLGWTANVLEQARDPRIIRPSARYVGPPAPQPVPSPA
ncbi:citrate/2-methylcitrate synthase [Angustibacter aerolatus]